MGAARIQVDMEFLRESLHLPVNTKIHSTETVYDNGGTLCVLTVTHPDLPDVAGLPPTRSVSIRKQEPIVFEGWV